jgi:hypothetical protein
MAKCGRCAFPFRTDKQAIQCNPALTIVPHQTWGTITTGRLMRPGKTHKFSLKSRLIADRERNRSGALPQSHNQKTRPAADIQNLLPFAHFAGA